METFKIPSLPFDLRWENEPVGWHVGPEGNLSISAGEATDWFSDPAGTSNKDNAPALLFTPPDRRFLLRAKVRVDFTSTFDAGALQIRARDDLWAKLCFEYSPQRQGTIVSVVTRGVSDDCNSDPIDGREVYLRIASNAQTFAFHYSRDGLSWRLVRYFTLGNVTALEVGFSSQSPLGLGCTAVFSEVTYREGALEDIRNGE
jgi:regulation of enolase protein 1 (concanavalin A-like superfamily)